VRAGQTRDSKAESRNLEGARAPEGDGERLRQRLIATQDALRASETRLLAISRLRDEFLATISHELRTPLNAILGWATLLRGGKLPPDKVDEAIAIIERNARAQVRLVDDLLDVSRVITGKLQLDVKPVSLLPLVRAVLDALEPTFTAKQIAVETQWNADREHDDTISGDPDRLQQVIWNLLSNAAKFTPPRGHVCVALLRTGSYLELRVEDNGDGIKPEFLPYVFDRFRQGESGTTRHHSGVGLGLAIVRHLVELHGGTVAAESPGEGQGATFIVCLPVRAVRAVRDPRGRPSRGAHRAPLHPVDASSIDLHGVTVLVVDDQAEAQALVKGVLQDAGAEAVGVSAVRDALELLTRFTPDVLVTDVGMPGEDGYSLIRQIRQREHERDRGHDRDDDHDHQPDAHLPAIALTAYSRAEDRAQALESGFDAHLRKPVERQDLLVAIAKALGRLPAH
jgi:signal transduction histidine kinase/AmiR/NasT family two-component response regulator